MTIESRNRTAAIKDAEYNDAIGKIEAQLDALSVKGSIKVDGSMELAYAFIKADGAKKSVVIVHGFSEFYRKYSEICWYFYTAGYNVFLYDQRGHGLSGREVDNKSLGHVNSYDDYADDLEKFIDRVVVPNSDGTDIFIYSHSMGGMVSLLYLMKRDDVVKKAILSSPMIRPNTKGMPSFMLRALVRRDAGKYGWDSKFRYAVTFNPNHEYKECFDGCYHRFRHNLDQRIADERYQNSSSTNRWMHESLTVHRRLLDKKLVKKIKSKVLIINAELDNVVRRAPQKKLAALGGFDYVSVKGAKHSIYVGSEKMMNEYLGLVYDFFDR